MKPTHNNNAGIHTLTWPDYQIGMRVDRIRESREHLTAEVFLKTTLPGVNTHLTQARHNLTSITARNSLARMLEERLPGLPWGEIIEQGFVSVIDQHREGAPLIRLGELPPQERVAYRVKPLLVERQANLLYGAGSTLKSYLAQYMSVLVESPLDHNGLEVEPGKIMYLDFETDEHEVAERIRMIQAGLGIAAPTDVLYRYGRVSLADDIENIQRLLMENDGITMLVIDSIGSACGGEPESADIVLRYFNALRSLNITTLSIDHANKENVLFGSVYKFNAARSVWETRKVQEPGDGFVTVGLYHRKMNSGQLIKPLAFQFSFDPDMVTVTTADPGAEPDLRKGLSGPQQVLAILRRGAKTTKELAEEMETSEGAIRTFVTRLDQVGRLNDGRVGLISKQS
jgi:hypothetical protein